MAHCQSAWASPRSLFKNLRPKKQNKKPLKISGPPQTCCIRIWISMRSPNGLYAHWRLQALIWKCIWALSWKLGSTVPSSLRKHILSGPYDGGCPADSMKTIFFFFSGYSFYHWHEWPQNFLLEQHLERCRCARSRSEEPNISPGKPVIHELKEKWS